MDGYDWQPKLLLGCLIAGTIVFVPSSPYMCCPSLSIICRELCALVASEVQGSKMKLSTIFSKANCYSLSRVQ